MNRNIAKLLLILVALALVVGFAIVRSGASTAKTPAEDPQAGDSALVFTTTAFDGSDVDESILTRAKITMVNFFEPWCPPCIAELPDLQKLSENYSSENFQMIGVFSTEEGVADILADAGTAYPVLRYVSDFDRFQTGYVPTTVFLDQKGQPVGEAVIGARSYEQWEAIIKGLTE